MKYEAFRLGHGTGKKFTSAGGSARGAFAPVLALCGLLMADPATARPGPFDALPIIEIPLEPEDQRRGGSPLSWHAAFDDTVLYGGTVWSPDSMRWEALRDSIWTFDTGVGSSINTGANPNKPIGYHQTMEGWFGIDRTLNPQPYFRRSSTCAISGSFSLWAGVTAEEATNLCYSAGQGYGDDWDLSVVKTFVYGGLGPVELEFEYSVDAEPTFDFAYVQIDTTGSGSAPDIVLWAQDGLLNGVGSFVLNPGSEMRSTPGPYTIRFRAASDGGYSDEDGLYASVCGLVAFDNVIVGSDTTDFEFGMNGWAEEVPTTGVGDFSHLADVSALPAPTAFCPCGHADSVLVFFDESGGHPLDQDNIAVSPWIDLLDGGDVGRPGKLFMYDVYSEMPLANYHFVQLFTRFYPQVCGATGLLRTSGFANNNNVIFYFGEAPFCNPTNAPRVRDFSNIIPPSAEQVQVAWGFLNLCRTAPYGPACTGVTNSTPWIDNTSLGVYGFPNAPRVSTSPAVRFHDNFASDGTFNPASPGRVDVALVKGGTSTITRSRLGDTLVAAASGANVEVRLVFRVHPGPFVSPSALAAAASRWTAEPALGLVYGGNWYSARMDTAEQGGVVTSSGSWMSTFHESDPGFVGLDTSPDPLDPGRLENDFIPDQLLTPGSRLDYFLAARFMPPDPRNPGGVFWAVDPDTSGQNFYEAEILPSSMGPDTTWNCVLYVDHHDDRDLLEQRIEEATLGAFLGTGGHGLEETRYDRWDVLASGPTSVSLGRPLESEYGASAGLLLYFTTIVWHSASVSSHALTTTDAEVLTTWFGLAQTGYRRNIWGTGVGLAQSMSIAGGAASAFMRNSLGVQVNCTSVRQENCPSGTPLDTTYYLATIPAPSAHFTSGIEFSIQGNGCPDLLGMDLLSPFTIATGAVGQRNYLKSGVGVSFATLSRINNDWFVPGHKAVLDGFPLGRIRASADSSGTEGDVTAAYGRVDDVLSWFDDNLTCGIPRRSEVPVPDMPQPTTFRASLGAATPNPTPGAARLSFVNAAPNARVRLDILDVSGRLVRTLVNGPLPAGPHELSWDGRAADGRPVADGLYFYRMTTDGFTEARKLVVLR